MTTNVLRKVAQKLPEPIRSLARFAYYRGGHWAHPNLHRFGTVQDLYYWVSDGNIDTLLLLQNYFSALYPQLDTTTTGSVRLQDSNGKHLGYQDFDLVRSGSARLRVSSLLERLVLDPAHVQYGTLEVNIAIPIAVLQHIKDQSPFYFWDRFYLGYTTSKGQTCFVHGVDKTHIYREGAAQAPTDWYKPTQGLKWSPEIPVNINEYEKLSVVLINRTNTTSTVSLTLLDSLDNSMAWQHIIPGKGIRRFELTPKNTAELNPVELRLQVDGLASRFGRPVVFKEFPNGAISAMHC